MDHVINRVTESAAKHCSVEICVNISVGIIRTVYFIISALFSVITHFSWKWIRYCLKLDWEWSGTHCKKKNSLTKINHGLTRFSWGTDILERRLSSMVRVTGGGWDDMIWQVAIGRQICSQLDERRVGSATASVQNGSGRRVNKHRSIWVWGSNGKLGVDCWTRLGPMFWLEQISPMFRFQHFSTEANIELIITFVLFFEKCSKIFMWIQRL